MRTSARRVGIALSVVGAALVVDVVYAGLRDITRRIEAVANGAQCEPWCPCECHQTMCGCHTPKVRLNDGMPVYHFSKSHQHTINLAGCQSCGRVRACGGPHDCARM